MVPTQGSGPIGGDYQETAGDASIENGCHTIEAQMPLWGKNKMLEAAGAAMLFEINSQTMMYAWNPDVTMHPASLVKIMTALVALENGDLDSIVTVGPNALASLPPDSDTLKLVAGEQFTLDQFLYAMMTGSANDAAVVIAEHIAGSQMGFAAMMNKRAKEIGCTGTFFVNAHGMHEDAQVTTARDMVKIVLEAIQNEDFLRYFSALEYSLPATDLHGARHLTSTNFLMSKGVTEEYYDARVTGGRTGVTDARERCLVATAESGGLKYVAIVLGAIPSVTAEGITRFGSYEEVGQLFDMGFKNHRITQILGAGDILTQYPVLNGENYVVTGPSRSVSVVLPTTVTMKDLSIRYQETFTSLTAPVEMGERLTMVQIWYNNVCIGQSPIITKNSSAVAENYQPVEYDITDSPLTDALTAIAIICAGVLGAAGILYIYQIIRRMMRQAQHKRRRRYRRRS
jgi:D-alanyl-D-alanine carboxypeptidase (penicillin-binding protein 5/6)